ncbi:MAG TPA: hypothetical protein VFH88_08835, partial [Candidatus Krumholzibacteria bacterium]|nr:hypothetical protein [Candidatus Krumholzibacteria bacterium]
IKKVCAWIYRKCDLIVDTSPCQRDRLKTYIATARHATCTPWAVVEPPAPVSVDDTERKALFGDTNLALIYSGNIGRAHHFDLILELARRLRDTGASMAFAVRGNGIPALKQAVLDTDTHIRFGEFVSQDRLEKRLSAADIHLLSLRPEWTGTLVPSKFFGAIAVGRPVIFLGSPKSGIAQWTEAYGLGWVLTPETIDRVTREVAQLPNDPAAAAALRERCFRTYHEHFSRKSVMDNWDRELRAVVQS